MRRAIFVGLLAAATLGATAILALVLLAQRVAAGDGCDLSGWERALLTFEDRQRVAGATGRVALAPVVLSLQDAKHALLFAPRPAGCDAAAVEALYNDTAEWMSLHEERLLRFMREEEQPGAQTDRLGDLSAAMRAQYEALGGDAAALVAPAWARLLGS